ncbi:hypothetical protein ANN_18947 [Periplaneta americana]|uniref:Uncharacterized protein n=1 Tax=Periplaneta americana TaxID=6978 RepID=A0ABQ8SQ61_PERAM|nr:hypothetical protein ANN_18947 [Periplaneta americana]
MPNMGKQQTPEKTLSATLSATSVTIDFSKKNPKPDRDSNPERLRNWLKRDYSAVLDAPGEKFNGKYYAILLRRGMKNQNEPRQRSGPEGDMWLDYIRQDGLMQSRCGTPTSERVDREDHSSDGLTCLPKRRGNNGRGQQRTEFCGKN